MRTNKILLEVNKFDHEYVIDVNSKLFIPEKWKVESHKIPNNLKINFSKIKFYLSEKQQNGSIEGNRLQEELTNKMVLGATVLDYLLKNPQLIPKEWRFDTEGNTRFIFFWGTIYISISGNKCVRCLGWNGFKWGWGYNRLDESFNFDNPAAILSG